VPGLLEGIADGNPQGDKQRHGREEQANAPDAYDGCAGILKLHEEVDELLAVGAWKELPNKPGDGGERIVSLEGAAHDARGENDDGDDRHEDLEGNGLRPKEDVFVHQLQVESVTVVFCGRPQIRQRLPDGMWELDPGKHAIG